MRSLSLQRGSLARSQATSHKVPFCPCSRVYTFKHGNSANSSSSSHSREGAVFRLPSPPSVAAAAAATVEPAAAEQPAEQQESAAPFDWSRHWYAVAVEHDVPRDRPYPFTLLGVPLVIWWDGTAWRCVEDACPHRAAPLSEGKVWKDGTLMCSYHGWRFRGEDGSCVAVPQAPSQEDEARMCDHRRSCAMTRPIREVTGLLFVFGRGGPEAAAEAAGVKVPLLDELVEGSTPVNIQFRPYHRDMPYDFETLVENVADPAHVPFSHHGVQGNRDSVKYGDYEMRRLGDMRFGPFMGFFDSVELLPPSIVAYKYRRQFRRRKAGGDDSDDGGWGLFITFATPVAPGRCRLLAQSLNTFKSASVPLPMRIINALPRWFEHITVRHTVLDGDNVFLAMQERMRVDKAREIERAGEASGAAASRQAWQRLYWMPAAADSLVAAFRSWLDGPGRGGPFGPLHLATAYPRQLADRRQLLDRWAHTQSCADCSRGFRAISALRAVAGAAAALALSVALCGLLAAASVAGGGTAGAAAGALAWPALRPAAWCAAAGAAAALLWRTLSKLREKFVFVDYVHAER